MAAGLLHARKLMAYPQQQGMMSGIQGLGSGAAPGVLKGPPGGKPQPGGPGAQASQGKPGPGQPGAQGAMSGMMGQMGSPLLQRGQFAQGSQMTPGMPKGGKPNPGGPGAMPTQGLMQ